MIYENPYIQSFYEQMIVNIGSRLLLDCAKLLDPEDYNEILEQWECEFIVYGHYDL